MSNHPRFSTRWRLVGAGLSNVWRFGDLKLSAISGRLLLRGPNGTGKTTAVEALWPFLLDLDATRLAAGKSRSTSLPALMREGATGKRRIGYAWVTFASASDGIHSFGVRLQYSDGASPPVRLVPFTVPGRPLESFALYLPGRDSLTTEQFDAAVESAGGQVFDSDGYVGHLGARIFSLSDVRELAVMASRLRQVRNPALLADLSADKAAEALRESLPGVDDDIISATAEALDESETTRAAFEQDREAAELLTAFSAGWCGHVVEVVGHVHQAAVNAAANVRSGQQRVKARTGELAEAKVVAADARTKIEILESRVAALGAEIAALEQHEAYKDAGRRKDLEKALSAQRAHAESTLTALRMAVRGLVRAGEGARRQLDDLIGETGDCVATATTVDPALRLATPLLAWANKSRAVVAIGAETLDPGPELIVRGDASTVRGVADRWARRADELQARADRAHIAIVDYRPVEQALSRAGEQLRKANEALERADQASAISKSAASLAEVAAGALGRGIVTWVREHPNLFSYDLALDALGIAEPARVLAQADEWATEVMRQAEAKAAELRALAGEAKRTARDVRVKAGVLRDQATLLRAGKLLPLPRPTWAGEGDDARAFGSAIDWVEDFTSSEERALIEAAVSAAGLLGATIELDGAATAAWRVDALGPIATPNLGGVITVDPNHEAAAATKAVLERIALVQTAIPDISTPSTTGLSIGRDGTFRAGVLAGRTVRPAVGDLPAPASHVGAHQRRTAALARAVSLEDEAQVLDEEAEGHEARAELAVGQANEASAIGRSFPARDDLRASESRRAAAETSFQKAFDHAEKERASAERLRLEAAEVRSEWLERTRSADLPIDPEMLGRLHHECLTGSQRLRKEAVRLGGRLARQLEQVLMEHDETGLAGEVSRTLGDADQARKEAEDTSTRLRVIDETMGAAIAEIVARHAEASRDHNRLTAGMGPARTDHDEAIRKETQAGGELERAQEELNVAFRSANETVLSLRRLLEVPGVADAIFDADAIGDDLHFVARVGAKLEGKKTRSRKSVREQADTAKYKLARTWAIDPGEDHGELLTFVLTHRDASYTPPQASKEAIRQRERAELSLAASEERALRDFVIGRLPRAISTAWTRLHDWITDANRKMRSASASSGVGVQVRAPLLGEDLAPAERVVYELACNRSDATRTPEEQRQLAEALISLLGAASGETMRERVAAATDIRRWVDVHYDVTRPGGKTQRWGLRTGLSNGERRLVVLAPMLAALAAAYDRLGSKVLRFVALDEVPAEVDEQGTEGLARYIAELDLDLICTSHRWDGSPGAWDGIDAHDLEAGPDGTVVGFPMFVRGAEPLPGDPESNGGDG